MSRAPGENGRAVGGANLLFKAVGILDIVVELGPNARLMDVAAAAGMPTATVHRILLALERAQLLRRAADTREYRLGPKLIQLARHALEDFDVRAAAQSELLRLAGEVQHTVLLAVYSGQSLVIIDRRDGQPPIALHAVGHQVQLHASALGKAALSSLPHAEQLQILESGAWPRFTGATITDPESLRGHLEYTANRRYALDEGELMFGVNGVAATIMDQMGRPIGAIGVYAPATVLFGDRMNALGHDLVETALRISGIMGMNPPEPWSNRKTLSGGGADVEEVIPARDGLGTSPVWLADQRRLAWVDVTRRSLFMSDTPDASASPDARPSEIGLPELPGSIARSEEGLFVALPSGIVDMGGGREGHRAVADVIAGQPHLRYNSTKCDSRGRLWTTTMDVSVSRPVGRLHRIDLDSTSTVMAEGLLLPIGIGWSPGETHLYLSDAPRREIYRWRYDAVSGALEDRRIFARVAEGRGRPTGLAVDSDGFVWSVQTDGWSVTRYDPEGRIERIVALPVPKPIDCCFGGADMRTLFITTGRLGMPERRLSEVPWSGSVLAIESPAPGLEAMVGRL